MELSGTINRSITLSGSMIARGLDGRGIVSIAKTGTSGLVDTYTITYTDETTSTFTVTNGANGQITATSFAEEFSSSKAYAAGDYVVYSGQLYQFTTAHAAGAWNASHATAVQIADQVSELKSAIDDIIETVESPNIFDQSNATVVKGEFLNPTNGNVNTNVDYLYVDDYIPVEAGEKYFISVWNKQSLAFYGNFNGFTLFYDENKTFISGLQGDHNPITIPENSAFIRISSSINNFNSNWWLVEKTSTRSTNYVPYFSFSQLKLPFVTVDINGNGSFTSIQEAVDVAEAGSAIIVMPGLYEEAVKAWGKEVHIIGVSREACIIKDTSGNYSTPPLAIGAGSVQNMTIIEQANGAGTENMGAYAIHVEDNNLYNKKLLIRNCYVYSDSSSAIGMGLRGGCSVRIEDCESICAGERGVTGSAPLYFHDADAQAYWGTANLYLHNNVLRNTSSSLFSMLTINSIHKENTTYMHMMYNIFVRSKTPALSQKFNTWNTSGNTDADGWNGLSHMYLEDDSFGNNLTELNYSA